MTGVHFFGITCAIMLLCVYAGWLMAQVPPPSDKR